jgi:hydrogenase 3 maturation protease
MFTELQERVTSKNILILGVGNRARGDDGIGSYLVRRLQKKISIPVIDAGEMPEKSLAQIESSGADLVLIVDAADMGVTPGEFSLLELDELKNMGVSTHTADLSLLFNIIPKHKRPHGLVVAVQPGSTLGNQLSSEARNALDGLEYLFLQLFRKAGK